MQRRRERWRRRIRTLSGGVLSCEDRVDHGQLINSVRQRFLGGRLGQRPGRCRLSSAGRWCHTSVLDRLHLGPKSIKMSSTKIAVVVSSAAGGHELSRVEL